MKGKNLHSEASIEFITIKIEYEKQIITYRIYADNWSQRIV